MAVIDELERVIDQSTASLRTLARSQRWCKREALLRTMPGIGLITAMTILAELGDVERFKSRAAVSNYAGLVPVVRDSNAKPLRRRDHAPRSGGAARGAGGGGMGKRGPGAAVRGHLRPRQRPPGQAGGDRRGRQANAGGRVDDAQDRQGVPFAPAAAAAAATGEQQRINDGSTVVDPSDAG